MALTRQELEEANKRYASELWRARWWMCCLNFRMMLLFLASIATFGVMYVFGVKHITRGSWIPCCCVYTATQVHVYVPTAPDFLQFKMIQVNNTDSNVLGPEILPYAQEMVAALANGTYYEAAQRRPCPKGDGTGGSATPQPGWSTCVCGKSEVGFKKIRLNYPVDARFFLTVALKMVLMSLAGLIFAIVPFTTTLAVFGLNLPCTTQVERDMAQMERDMAQAGRDMQ